MQVTREQAKLIYSKQNHNYKKTYAEVALPNKSSIDIAGGVRTTELVMAGWVGGGREQEGPEKDKSIPQ